MANKDYSKHKVGGNNADILNIGKGAIRRSKNISETDLEDNNMVSVVEQEYYKCNSCRHFVVCKYRNSFENLRDKIKDELYEKSEVVIDIKLFELNCETYLLDIPIDESI